MEWTFSIEVTFGEKNVAIYFLEAADKGETYYQAIPYPSGIISPFSMKLDKSVGEFKIAESNVPLAIKEYELIFNLTIQNINDLSKMKENELIVLN